MSSGTQELIYISLLRETGQPFHKINVWQDLRASDMVKEWNRSFTLRVRIFCWLFPSNRLVRCIKRALHIFTGSGLPIH